jgi:hypothetical protein
MANTSATGGVLLPADAPAPAEDADLDAIFQTAIASVTGLPGSLVRPRWQPGNPKQPEAGINWCALGVTVCTPDDGPYLEHRGAGVGSTSSVRHEDIEVLTTFYGPRSKWYAGVLRDGLGIPQNVEGLRAQDISFTECGPARAVHEFVNQQWIRRQDVLVRFRRKVSRTYAINNVLSADIHLFDDTHIDEIIQVPPAP